MRTYHSAIGSSSIEEQFRNPSISKSEAIETVLDILESKESLHDNILTDSEYDVLSMCLDSIGSQKVTQAEDGSLEGRSTIVYTVETGDTTIEVTSDFQVQNVWDRTRREWACTMGLRKTAGTEIASEMDFEFIFASFGHSDDGRPIILFNFSYERKLDAPSQLQAFNKGGMAKMSEYDITGNVQWGYLVIARCTILFESGLVLHA